MLKSIPRGMYGYCDRAKRSELIKSLIMFAIVIAILMMGIVTTGSRMNLLTIVAVVGCLPASRYLVNFIARAPYSSLSEDKVRRICEAAGEVLVWYELMVGGKDKVRFIDCIAISGHAICGLATHSRVSASDAQKRLLDICKEQGKKDVTVKIYEKEEDFLHRLSQMREHYGSDEKERQQEEALGHTITLYCL